MRRLSAEEVKERLFLILSDFAEYCDKHGIRYRLCGGTLLGAVRHHDFIPWDDDVDLFMPRPDYEKLHECIAREPVGSFYELHSWENHNFIAGHAKIVDVRTVVNTKYQNDGNQLWIDIFPVDGIPIDKQESDKLLIKAQKLRKIYMLSIAKVGEGKSLARKIGKLPFLIIPKIRGSEYYTKRIETLAKQNDFDTSEYVGAVMSSCGSGERMKKSEFINSVEMLFHGRNFHAPVCWDSYLHGMYGDYMQIPSKEKRINHAMEVYVL